MIMTGSPEGDSLEIAALRSTDVPGTRRIDAAGESAVAQCYTRGKTIIVSDVQGSEVVPGVPAASMVCLPLVAGSVVRGVMLLWSEEKERFQDSDLGVLAMFVHYASILLEVDELSERLGENQMIDPLTGLYNRRQFDKRFHEEFLRAERYSANLSLVIFDVDDLEAYNNNCGYVLGNLALSDIASLFIKSAREVDFLARVGPDEFAAVCPETTRIGALRFAERLRSAVAAYPFPVSDESVSASLTVSAGIANFPGSASDEETLLARTYEALEEAKRSGPDRIKLWGENPSVSEDKSRSETTGGETSPT